MGVKSACRVCWRRLIAHAAGPTGSDELPPMTASTGRRNGPAWLSRLPPARWLAEYRAAWLPGDRVAGITLAAFAIPVSLAYAALAGLPPQVGIYGYLLGGLGYALLGSSRQLAIGPTSAISLMIAGTVGAMAEGGGHADQRQHPGRLQSRCRADHRDDPAAELLWRDGRRAQFLRPGGAVRRAARPDACDRAGRRY